MAEVKEEPDCLEHCASRVHGKELCSLSTAASGANAVPMWIKKCANYAHASDIYGRTCLHIVASTGNTEAMEWLIKRAGCDIDKKDKISGYTALHRSIFFGQIHSARSLINYNADTHLKDNEGLTAFELCHADRPRPFTFKIRSDPTELFVWGTNDNYTLGNTIQQSRHVPEQLELFRKNGTRIMQVALSTYHSLFLTQLGEVYVCGSGRGGKLGLGHESSVLTPEILHVKPISKCMQIAAGVDHSLFVMENGKVLSCGSNEFGAIGQKALFKEIKVPRFVDVQKVPIKGVLAAQYHSVFYNSRKIFTCGYNGGQLGHSSIDGSPIIYEPKMISQVTLDPDGDTKFTHFAINTFATVARASTGFVYVFHKFDCQKINAKQFDVEKLQVIGGSFADASEKPGKIFKDNNSCDEPLTILMLTTTGRIVIWRETLSGATFSRVVFNSGRGVFDFLDFCVSRSCILFVTRQGEAYQSKWKPSNIPILMTSWQQRAQNVMQDQNDFQISSGSRRSHKGKDSTNFSVYFEHLKIQRIKNIYTAGNITCDSKGNNFAIIQASPKLDLTQLPEIEESKLNSDFSKFLEEASLEDCLHDVIFQVESRRFPGHLYIIASGCPKLYNKALKISKNMPEERPIVVPIENINNRVFEQILQFIYSNTCDLLTPGKQHVNSQDMIKLTIEAARKLELEIFCKELRKVELVEGTVFLKSGEFCLQSAIKRFNCNLFENLSDITLLSKDGHSLNAHKCILVGRSDYFHSMLYANSWLEQGSIKPIFLQFSKLALEVLLEFIYTDDVSNLPSTDFDSLSEILAMSDNFFMDRLRNFTENALTDLLSLKNVAAMLYLADRCNAHQLQDSCMQFISLNLALVLENKILDPLPMEIVKGFSKYYCQLHPTMDKRMIKSAWDAPSEKDFQQETENMSSELKEELIACSRDEEIRKPQIKTSRNKPRLRSRASESEADASSNKPHDFLVDNQQKFLVNNSSQQPTNNLLSKPNFMLDASTSSSQREQQPARRINFPTNAQTMKQLKIAEAEQQFIKPKLNPLEFPSLEDIDKTDRKTCGKIVMKSSSQSNNNNSDCKSPANAGPVVINIGSSFGSGKKKIKWKAVNINSVASQHSPVNECDSSTSNNQSVSLEPKNPWKINDTKKVAFKEIVQEEVEKKENFQRAVTKSLNLMQIEDLAINQLTAHYNSKDVEDGIELVSVERVCSNNYANPTWVQRSSINFNYNHNQWPKTS